MGSRFDFPYPYLRQASDFLVYRLKLQVTPQEIPIHSYHASTYTYFHHKDLKKHTLSQIYQIAERLGIFIDPISNPPPTQSHA